MFNKKKTDESVDICPYGLPPPCIMQCKEAALQSHNQAHRKNILIVQDGLPMWDFWE